MRSLTHDEQVRSVAETACELYFRARPLTRASDYAKVQEATLIRPCVRRVESIPGTGAVTGELPNLPLIAAEVECLRGVSLRLLSFRRYDGNNPAAFLRQYLHRGRRAVSRFDQEGGILS